MSDLPRITIVMPCFNQSMFIEESIRSVLDQNYPNLEFLILDGGSTDGSQEIIKRYSDHLAYWRSHRDKGQTDALIQGFSRATGELIGWLNSDDVLLPGALFHIVQAFKSHPKRGLFAGNILVIDENGKIIRTRRPGPSADFFARYGLFVIAQPGSFFTRRDYEAVGGMHGELQYAQDLELYMGMMNNRTPYIKVNAWVSGFRLHSLSKTISQTSKQEQEYELVRREYLTWIKRSPWGRIAYVGLQVVNGNYLRMVIDILSARGKHWKKWCESNLVVQHEEWRANFSTQIKNEHS
jgi:glycosyltransferase involved in cell wall biosynthesis